MVHMETLQKLREKVEKGKALMGRTTTETIVIVEDFMPYSIFAILGRLDRPTLREVGPQ